MSANTESRFARALVVSTILGPLAWTGAAWAAAAPAKVIVESWVRPAGDAAALEAAAPTRTKVELDSLPRSEGRRFDAQYGKYQWFEGVPLTALLARLKPPAAVDLALLHFANGMVVPLPLADRQLLDQLDPFIALKMRASPDAPYRAEFPPLTKRARDYVDVPATRFSGNKLVVARLWHPALGEKLQADFSPWALADSLIAVEFVQTAAYYKQFDVDPDPKARTGLALFQQSCQFCHGARKVGAKFGWDFVEPAPLYTYRKGPTRLYYHVHFRRYDAVARGQQMPALRSMSKEDAANLWQWLEAVGTKPMPPYAPGH
jgi:mono/diheme cytochrome c family protein